MIRINDVSVDCLVSFEQGIDISRYYDVVTMDGKRHAKRKGAKEKLAMTLAPRTADDNDTVWSLLQAEKDYITIEFPNTSNTFSKKEYVVSSFNRPLIRKEKGKYIYGEISVSCEER